jgi:hypothetical protein
MELELSKLMPIYNVPKILGGVKLGSASAGQQWTGPSDFDHEVIENG